jgi:ribA/ribD-fused uncharacterized protein
MVIQFFSQSSTHRDFSNFAPFGIDLDGRWWPTVEHFYQAQKFTDPELQSAIQAAEKPAIAKKLANKNKDSIRPYWDAVKDEIMYRALRRKFELHPQMCELLLSTGDEHIEENAPTDFYWGVGHDSSGQNKLGVLLMQVRAELRKQEAAVAEPR